MPWRRPSLSCPLPFARWVHPHPLVLVDGGRLTLVGQHEGNEAGQAAELLPGLTLTLTLTLCATLVWTAGPVPRGDRCNGRSAPTGLRPIWHLTLSLALTLALTLTTGEVEEASSDVAEVSLVTELLPRNEPDATSRKTYGAARAGESGVAAKGEARVAAKGEARVAASEGWVSDWSEGRVADWAEGWVAAKGEARVADWGECGVLRKGGVSRGGL